MGYENFNEHASNYIPSASAFDSLKRGFNDAILGVGTDGITPIAGPLYISGGVLKSYAFTGVVDGCYFNLDADADLGAGYASVTTYIHVAYRKVIDSKQTGSFQDVTFALVVSNSTAVPTNYSGSLVIGHGFYAAPNWSTINNKNLKLQPVIKSPQRWFPLKDFTPAIPVKDLSGTVIAVWQALTAYNLGDYVIELTGTKEYIFQCTVAGTTAAGEPVWPAVQEGTVADGTVTWTARAINVIDTSADLRNIVKIGMPIRIKYAYYNFYNKGIVINVSATQIFFAGYGLTRLAGFYINEVDIGTPEMVRQVRLTIATNYNNADDADLLANDMGEYFDWHGGTAHLVRLRLMNGIDDTAVPPYVTVTNNGSIVFKEYAAGTIVSTAWDEAHPVAVDNNQYVFTEGDAVEVKVVNHGVPNNDAYYLNVELFFIQE